MKLAVRRQRRSLDGAEIALTAAAVDGRVAVEALAPAAGARHPDAVVMAQHRSEVADHEHRRTRLVLAQERDHAGLAVMAVDPLETLRGEVELVERRRSAIEAVQIAHPL